METVNERTDLTLTIKFYDENKNPVVPTTVRYRIDDEATKTQILTWNPVPPAGQTYIIIQITAAQNAMVATNPIKPFEAHLVTVEMTYSGGTRQATEEYRFYVRNLLMET
jgi:hypothetical protein